MEKTESGEALQYLTFLLAGGEYAIRILQAREIIEYEVVTRVPQMPAWIRGVINLRGTVVPVVDLGTRFALGGRECSKITCIVIAEVVSAGECLPVGFIVDSVSEVVEFTAADIEPVPSFGTQISPEYLSGMGKRGKELVLILDIEKVLTAPDLTVLDALREAVAESQAEGASEVNLSAAPGGEAAQPGTVEG